MKKKVIILIIAVIVVIASVITVIALNKKDNNCNQSALTFKEEYEKYNNKKITIESKKYKLTSLSISETNPMKKIAKDKLINTLTKSTGVVFFTSPIDFVSREMIPVILSTSKNYDCDVIYYYDIDELTDNETKNELTNILQKKNIDSLQNGTILFIQKGKIKEFQVGISKDYKYGKKISEEDKKTLSRTIKNGFNSINSNMCEKQTQC